MPCFAQLCLALRWPSFSFLAPPCFVLPCPDLLCHAMEWLVWSCSDLHFSSLAMHFHCLSLHPLAFCRFLLLSASLLCFDRFLVPCPIFLLIVLCPAISYNSFPYSAFCCLIQYIPLLSCVSFLFPLLIFRIMLCLALHCLAFSSSQHFNTRLSPPDSALFCETTPLIASFIHKVIPALPHLTLFYSFPSLPFPHLSFLCCRIWTLATNKPASLWYIAEHFA